MAKEDILFDTVTNDLYIRNGTFPIGECGIQEALNIIMSNKGEYRQYPVLGVGIFKYIGIPGILLFCRVGMLDYLYNCID